MACVLALLSLCSLTVAHGSTTVDGHDLQDVECFVVISTQFLTLGSYGGSLTIFI